MLEIKDLTKIYNKNSVLEKANYIFEKGKIYGIIGKNGVGKTTLFNCISNKEDFSGYITLDGEKFNSSYVTSTPIVPDFLTIREFLNFFLEKDCNQYLDYMEIKVEDRDKLLKECSLGTRSKAQIFVNLYSNNEVILLDEPFMNVDITTLNKIVEHINKIKKNHIIILSTHKIDILKMLCDEVIILKDKKLNKIEIEDILDNI